jgi:hypothetical protein
MRRAGIEKRFVPRKVEVAVNDGGVDSCDDFVEKYQGFHYDVRDAELKCSCVGTG